MKIGNEGEPYKSREKGQKPEKGKGVVSKTRNETVLCIEQVASHMREVISL